MFLSQRAHVSSLFGMVSVLVWFSPGWNVYSTDETVSSRIEDGAFVLVVDSSGTESRGAGQGPPTGTGPGSGRGTTGGTGKGSPGGTGPGSGMGSTGATEGTGNPGGAANMGGAGSSRGTGGSATGGATGSGGLGGGTGSSGAERRFRRRWPLTGMISATIQIHFHHAVEK